MKFPFWWTILLIPLSLAAAVFYLRLGNGFVARSGDVHIAYDQEEGYRFIRNGKPFYVRGASGDAFFEELKHCGGNTIRIYQPDSLPTALERAEKLGIVVVADLPLPTYQPGYGYYGVPAQTDSILAATREIIVAHKDNPALLCWILGNEIHYTPEDENFTTDFDALIAMIRQEDPNHPVGTAMVPYDLIKMHLSPRSTGLDFVALNIFGSLTDFEKKKNWFRLAWTGPYLFSEWGINGPWESEATAWGAPLEPPSTKKAELLRRRYESHVGTITDGRCLGSLAFYWGQKQERTPTWFSFFSTRGRKSQACHELKNLWAGTDHPYNGVAINYLLLAEKGAHDNIVFHPGVRSEAIANYQDRGAQLSAFNWSIRPEDWMFYVMVDSLATQPLPGLISEQTPDRVHFQVPDRPGPYRLYLEVEDSLGYFATANVPFYVMKPSDSD